MGTIYRQRTTTIWKQNKIFTQISSLDKFHNIHYDDVIMDTIASQITSLAIVYSIVYSSAVQRKHQSSASLAFVWGIHRGPVNSPHKGPVTRKMFPFDDVIMFIVVFCGQKQDLPCTGIRMSLVVDRKGSIDIK